MPYCAHCGSPVAETSYRRCPSCGSPNNGAPRPVTDEAAGGITARLVATGRMYCTHCGGEHEVRDRICPDCGKPIDYPPAVVLSNYLVPALLVTLCCCPPFGVVAIIFSALVNSRLAEGDIAGAQRASTRARTWTMIAFGTAALALGGAVLLALLNR